MQGYGPFTATLGNVTKIPLSQAVTRVYFYNDSTFDCLVAVSQSQPDTGATAISGGWQTIIPAMHGAFVPNALGAATFYAMPINSRAPNQGLNGTVSNLQNLWVTPLTATDSGFDVMPALRQSDLSSQLRTISVPFAPAPTTQSLPATVGDQILVLAQASANNLANGTGNVYVFGYSWSSGIFATNQAMQVELDAITFFGGGIITRIPIHTFEVGIGTTQVVQGGRDFTYPISGHPNFGGHTSGIQFGISVNVLGVSAGGWSTNFNISVGWDLVNFSTPGTYGGVPDVVGNASNPLLW